jgi:putative tryptophan/tyrosine transport system substrate-binding protein
MNLWRREFALWFALALTAPHRALAQIARRPVRVAILSGGSQAVVGRYTAAFRNEMRELGWHDGTSIVYEQRYAAGDQTKLPELAAEVVAWRPDVILATTTYAAQSLRPKTATIPIVMATSLDPVSEGLAASFARPGGNITGMSIVGEAFHAKLVELTHNLLPNAGRVALLINPDRGQVKKYLYHAREAGTAVGVDVEPIYARNRSEIDSVLAALPAQRFDALIIVPDAVFVYFRALILERATQMHLPAVGPIVEFANDGALASYGTSIPAAYRRSAHFVDKILRGAKPADLPIEQATVFELVINRRVAQKLGVTVPPSVMVRADRVIE